MKKDLINRLIQNSNMLDNDQKLQLGIAICERMLACYEDFSISHNFGDSLFLKNTLTQLKKGISSTETTFFYDHIDAILPDMDDFSGLLLATAALDAGAALYELVVWVNNHDPKHIKTLFSLALNANEMYVSDFTDEPFSHPLLLSEIALFETWIGQIAKNLIIEQPENNWLEKFKEVDAG